MKITRVESIVLLDKFQLVRVETDEGVTGIGEVSTMNVNVQVTHAMIEHAMSPLLVGEDPANIERLWQRMYHKLHKHGPMGVQLAAMAGVDIALWDIAGKVAGQAPLRAPRRAGAGSTGRCTPARCSGACRRRPRPRRP